MKYTIKSKRVITGLIVLGVFLVVAAAATIWLPRGEAPVEYLPGETQALRDRVKVLETKTPDENASVETKIKYYDELVQAKRTSGDTEGTAAAFEKRLKISDQGLDYLDYLHIAVVYKALDRKADALNALEQAEKKLPPDSLDEGFYRMDVNEDIANLRSELQ